jgi:hypothetical protein
MPSNFPTAALLSFMPAVVVAFALPSAPGPAGPPPAAVPRPPLPLGGARPIWSRNATAQFVLLRRPFNTATTPPRQRTLLHISAQPIPNRLAGPRHGGSLASKLLCAYKLWVNGVPVGAGPGRPTGKKSTRDAPALLCECDQPYGFVPLW